MINLDRVWDWLLPGLICLNPMGALAYYGAGGENEASQPQSSAAAARRSSHYLSTLEPKQRWRLVDE